MRTSLALVLALFVSGCVSLDYDLSSVPIPVSAKPLSDADREAVVEPFELEARNVLWVHGLFGHRQPDVAALVRERAAGWDRIADFRVRQVSNVHHWLTTHLTLTLIRMRKVVVSGVLVRGTDAP